MRKKQKSPDFSMRLNEEDKARLRAVAKLFKVSQTEVVRRLVRKALEQFR